MSRTPQPSLRADRLRSLPRRGGSCSTGSSASTRHADETHILMYVLLRIYPNLTKDSAAERARRPSRLEPSGSHPTMDHSALLVQLDKASTPEQRQQSQGLNLVVRRVKGAPKLLHWAKHWPCKELSCSSSSNKWHNEELSNSSNRWHRSSTPKIMPLVAVRVRPFVRRAASKALRIQKCESASRHRMSRPPSIWTSRPQTTSRLSRT